MQRYPYSVFLSTLLVVFCPVQRSLAASDLDNIFIDMEHTPMDGETLRSFLLGMINPQKIAESGSTRMQVTPIVRIL